MATTTRWAQKYVAGSPYPSYIGTNVSAESLAVDVLYCANFTGQNVNTKNNILDDGSGNVQVNGNLPGMLSLRSAAGNESSVDFSSAGASKVRIGWHPTSGFFVYDMLNNSFLFTQNGLTKGYIKTLNNTLDDGTGGSMFTYGTATKNGLGVGANIDFNNNYFGLAVAAPTGSGVWPFGVMTGGGGAAKRMLAVTAPNVFGSANGQVLTLNNMLDDGAGASSFTYGNWSGTKNGLAVGAPADFNGAYFGLGVAAPAAGPNWPFGVMTGGGTNAKQAFTVKLDGSVNTNNGLNKLDDGSGNMTLAGNFIANGTFRYKTAALTPPASGAGQLVYGFQTVTAPTGNTWLLPQPLIDGGVVIVCNLGAAAIAISGSPGLIYNKGSNPGQINTVSANWVIQFVSYGANWYVPAW